MPTPFKVELEEYNPDWAAQAKAEADVLRAALPETLIAVHHIGSTAIPGVTAKPIFDLIPVVRDVQELDAPRQKLEALGYEWWGEYGLPGRRYLIKDKATGRRLVQLHCYADGSPEIERHLAFREYLRQRPDVVKEYSAEKERCRKMHGDSSHGYADCKSAWIEKVEAKALEDFKG